MRRNAARIGIVAALTLSMGVATATAPPARADDPTSLIAPARASAGLMNYAINLSPGAAPADLERALAMVSSAGGVALASYPQIGTFFAQSESASFAPDMAEALAGSGNTVHSIGPTRVAAVPEVERVKAPAPGEKPDPAPAPAPEPTPDPAQSGDGTGQSGAQSGAQSGGVQSARGRALSEADGTEEISNWGAAAMSVAEAAGVPVAHAPVTVGVIDTGIDDMHPDLVGRVDQTRSVSCASNGVASQEYGGWRDDYFHGTHVAGIIAANHNGIGIDGVAPYTTLVSIKAANSEQLIYPEYVTCAFMWAASHGVDIVNNSYSMDPWMYWSSTDPEQAAGLEAATRAITYAQSKGLAVIASAGNEGADNDHPTTDSGSPTDMDTPIKDRSVAGSIRVPGQVAGVSQVSALKRVDEETKPEWTTLARADFSNYGTTIDFAAPGDGIYSTVPTAQYPSGYAKTSGTSMAAPHITGIAALIKATHPSFTGRQIIDLMRKQAAIDYTRLEVPADGKEYRGYGFINALTTMRRDQMQPTVTTLEYRVGKGEWKSLDGATLPAGSVTFYAAAASPISHLHMDVASLTGVDRDGSGKYGDPELSVSAENVARRHGLGYRPRPSQRRRHQLRPPSRRRHGPRSDLHGLARPRRRAPARTRPGHRRSPRARRSNGRNHRPRASQRTTARQLRGEPPRGHGQGHLRASRSPGLVQGRTGPGALPAVLHLLRPIRLPDVLTRPGRGAHQGGHQLRLHRPHPPGTRRRQRGRGPHRLHDPRASRRSARGRAEVRRRAERRNPERGRGRGNSRPADLQRVAPPSPARP